jgi:hypothetical protein
MSERDEQRRPPFELAPGALESLVRDVIRRAATLGFSGFFATEEAVRKAFQEVVPDDWVDYANRQSDEVRGEMIDRLAAEFGRWLETLDPADLLGRFLESHEVSATVTLTSRPRRQGGKPPAEGGEAPPLRFARRPD